MKQLAAVLALLWASAASAQLTVQITSPQSPVGDQMTVTVTSDSVYSITQLDVTFRGQTTSVPNGTVFDTSAVPSGTYPLSVTAHDFYGATGTASTTVTVDRFPRITVQQPLDFTVSNGALVVQASCSDDGPEGCTSFSANVSLDCPPRSCIPPPPGLSTSGGTLAGTIDVSRYAGLGNSPPDPGSVRVIFTAADARGQQVYAYRALLVERSQRLVPWITKPGKVLDFDGDRVLWLEQGAVIHVSHLASGAEEQLAEAGAGTLIAGAAVVSTYTGAWELPETGSPRLLFRRAVLGAGGRLVAFSTDATGYTLYDLGDGGTPALIASGDGYSVDITRDGQAAYLVSSPDGGNSRLVRFTSNSTEIEIPPYYGVRTDGTTAVAGDQVFAPGAAPATLPPGTDLNSPRVVAGSVAYHSTAPQVFVRWADGGTEQRTGFTTGARLREFAPNGEIIASAAGGLYYLPIDRVVPIPFSETSTGRPMFIDGGWTLLLGNTVFRLDPSNPVFIPDGGVDAGDSPGTDGGGGGGTQPPPPACGCSATSGLTALAALLAAAARRRGVRSPAPASAPSPAPAPARR